MAALAHRAFALGAVAALFACSPGTLSGDPPAEVLPTDPIYYVDAKSGRDSNHGRTAAAAFQTLQRAASAVKPGWTVLVMDGTYTSDGSVNPLTLTISGTSDAWITFAAAPGQHPVIRIPRGPEAWAGIYLPGVSYVIIDGFEIVGQGKSIAQQEASTNNGTQAVLNHNCIYIDGMGFGNTHPDIPHDIVIRNSVLHDCTAAGIEANVADAITIEHNKVYDNSWWTVFGTSGIGLWHFTDAPGSGTKNGYKNRIVGNLVYGNKNNMDWRGGNPPGIYDGNGIILDDSRHSQPAGGVHDVQGVGYTGRTYIANNIVHDNGGRGIHVYSSDHVDIVNNTSWNNLLTSSRWIFAGEIDCEHSSDCNILNNIGVNLVGKQVNMDDGNRYDYNIWQAEKVPYKGPNDIVGPAVLTDPAKGSFAPASGSPALKSGTGTLAPPDDYLGNPRPAGAIDRGAIQVSR